MFVPFLAPLASGKMKFVLKSASKATAALNGLPCLLLKPLRTSVFPFASKSVISPSVSVFPDCTLPVFRQIAGKTLTDGEMTDLLTEGKTGVLGGFKSRQGKPFSAAVAFDADFNTNFIFPEAKGARKGTNMKGKRK
jgi:hypothetical protein